MKNIVPRPVFVAALVTGVLIAGCNTMGGSPAQPTTPMPDIDTQRVCEIQRQWNSMSPDQQVAVLNYHLRSLQRTYGENEIDALRQRVRTTRC